MYFKLLIVCLVGLVVELNGQISGSANVNMAVPSTTTSVPTTTPTSTTPTSTTPTSTTPTTTTPTTTTPTTTTPTTTTPTTTTPTTTKPTTTIPTTTTPTTKPTLLPSSVPFDIIIINGLTDSCYGLNLPFSSMYSNPLSVFNILSIAGLNYVIPFAKFFTTSASDNNCASALSNEQLNFQVSLSTEVYLVSEGITLTVDGGM